MSDDAIDKSEWTPLAWMDERYKFLKEKGLAYYNGKKILPAKKAKLPIDRLHDDDIAKCDGYTVINDEQYHAAYDFSILWDCAEGRSSGRDAKDGEPSQKDAVLQKIAIEKQLQPFQKHMVRCILIYSRTNPMIEEEFKAMRERITSHVRNAFDALIEAMKPDNIQKVLDDRRKNS